MTAQADEILIFDGKETLISSWPPLPRQHPGIIQRKEEIDQNIQNLAPIIGSTACWRGYIGTWKIQDEQLYLINLVGCYEMVDTHPIFADWVSGLIRVPQGKLLYGDRSGTKVYAQEIHLRIEQGKVIESTLIDSSSSQW